MKAEDLISHSSLTASPSSLENAWHFYSCHFCRFRGINVYTQTSRFVGFAGNGNCNGGFG
jgi:hypothetical protein